MRYPRSSQTYRAQRFAKSSPMRADASFTAASAGQAVCLLTLAVAVLIAAGVAPHDRLDWLLESTLPAALLVGLGLAWRHWRLSFGAYLALLMLLAIHALGAHFTYAKVPYEQWLQALTGHTLEGTLGWQRNHYDRLVHCSYGLLMLVPLRQSLARLTPLRGLWLTAMALSLVLSTSALYELIEWLGGEYLGDDQAKAFVATQADPWDAQKDMALALLGALLASAVATFRDR